MKTTTTMERIHPWERLIDFYFEIGLKYKDINAEVGNLYKNMFLLYLLKLSLCPDSNTWDR